MYRGKKDLPEETSDDDPGMSLFVLRAGECFVSTTELRKTRVPMG
jgi:hypothetical protein